MNTAGSSGVAVPDGIRVIGAEEVRAAVPMQAAITAVQRALRDGLDPEADPPRSAVPVDRGHLLLMPSQSARYVGVKIASVAPDNPAHGRARIQGGYLLMDAPTLTPVALLDGVALTSIRTAAVSAAAVDLLAAPDAARLVLFGTGPQAHGHLAALRAIRPVRHVTVVGRDQKKVRAFLARHRGSGPELEAGTAEAVADADLVACCTSARTPLFDGDALQAHATVAAVGSHEPEARETDDATVRRCTVVVEARSAALREAGDVIQPVTAGALDASSLVTMAELLRGEASWDPSRPRLFKGVGMAWEDLVVAGAAFEAAR